MKSIFVYLIGQSILLPLFAGLIRWRRIGKTYQPFLILLAAGFVNELINGYVVEVRHMTNAINTNIFTLVEWLLILWQFRVWGFLLGRKNAWWVLLFLSCSIWIVENLVLARINGFPPYFSFFYSFCVVMLSVNKINFMITHDNRSLLGNPGFLICIGFIIYYIYKIIYEWAYQTSLFGATEITSTIILLFGYINALTNIIFAIALLKIPAPEKFTLR